MKKVLLSLFLMATSMSVFAQKEVTIKGGTVVPVEAIRNIRATEVNEGQNVDLKVSRDVVVDGVVAIPAGTIVKGNVYEAKRSTAFGTRGRLGITLTHLYTANGETVNLVSSNIYIKGKNRTAISVIVFIFTLLPFPCGSKAELKTGVEYSAMVAGNTTITVGK